jgi:hypothetical protein
MSLPDFKQIWIFMTDFHKKPPISNLTEILPMGAALILGTDKKVGEWTGGHEEANIFVGDKANTNKIKQKEVVHI